MPMKDELMPDSSAHIARLEAKLSKLEKRDNSKINGKDLLTSMTEFKEIYLRDRMKNESHTGLGLDEAGSETIDKSYLERKLLPEQPINKEEVQVLLENDWLNKRNESLGPSNSNNNSN